MPPRRSIDRHSPPYRLAGTVLVAIVAVSAMLFTKQYRGDFTPRVGLTVASARAGLVVDPGSKVTLNGVEIGRVTGISTKTTDDVEQAMIALQIDPRYLSSIPKNVVADVRASTVFGNKYVAFSSPEDPSHQSVSGGDVIRAASVTTEFNSLFEAVTAIAEKIDPVKLNQTLTATAEALTGHGARFGTSLQDANVILDDLDPRLPRFREDVARAADLAEVYTDAAPNLLSGLQSAATTARTLDGLRDDVDAALMAAIGFADTATEPLERSTPYLVRATSDLVPTTKLLDDYRGMIFCTIRNYHDVAPRIQRSFGGDNGYSLVAYGAPTGVGNPYVYPDNLPRTNAHGGPEGRPGCWQKVTHKLWPHPYLVTDTGFSLAPYNHVELARPLVVENVWGRQIGEHTINP